MNEQALVKNSILEVFSKSGYSNPAQMTQRDFDYIATEIEKKSGILVSGTTIRRLALGDFSRLPQVATLNAIANYFEYSTWQDFKASRLKIDAAITTPTETHSTNGHVAAKPKRSKTMTIWIIAGVLILIAASSLYFFRSKHNTISNAEAAKFSCQRSTANEIPNTVIFNYDVDNVQADSFFIQQSWDKNRRVRIYKNKHTLTDIYYEPGYHIAKLIANDSIIKAIPIHIPTDRWFFYAIDNVRNYIPEYIKTDQFIDSGVLRLSKQQLQESNIDITKDKLYHYTWFPSEMKVKSDNFRLRTRIKMTEVRNNLCPYITIELFCQGYFVLIKTTKTGCANTAKLLLNQEIEGSETDLTALTFDVTQWTDVEIAVTNNIATISINNKQVYSAPNFDNVRLLSGLAFISNGLCEVDKVELVGGNGVVMYKNEF